jgi:hypothetical protein
MGGQGKDGRRGRKDREGGVGVATTRSAREQRPVTFPEESGGNTPATLSCEIAHEGSQQAFSPSSRSLATHPPTQQAMVAAPRTIPPFPYRDLLTRSAPFNDWRDDLARDGYAVVKGAIPRDKALEYRSRAFDWLESFGRGFDRNDPDTFSQAHLPQHSRGGMYSAHGVHQEQWVRLPSFPSSPSSFSPFSSSPLLPFLPHLLQVWDIRLEPGIKKAFSTLWGTEELVVSMDGGAIMLPGQPTLPSNLRVRFPPLRPPPLLAQALPTHSNGSTSTSPRTARASSSHRLVSSLSSPAYSPRLTLSSFTQGLVNLNDNGPEDGGLVVLKGSSALIKEYFDEHGRPPLAPEGEKVRSPAHSRPFLSTALTLLCYHRSTGTVRLPSHLLSLSTDAPSLSNDSLRRKRDAMVL